MAGIVRANVDKHVGHASPTPNPFHQTAYAEPGVKVFIDGEQVIRKGDKTICGDPAVGSASNVYVEGKLVHLEGDATGGHESWVPNRAASGSSTVFVGNVFSYVINVSPEHEASLRDGQKAPSANADFIEYGDGGISNGDGEFLSKNTSAVNGVTGPQDSSTGNADAPSTFERVSDPALNFLPHTDSRIETRLRNILIRIAKSWGQNLTITSAYRSPEYNKKVGGAKNSMHQQGKATDIVMTGYSNSDRARFIEIAINEGIGGVGVYNTFIHVDTGGKRAWGSNGSRRSLPKYPYAQTVLAKYGYATS
jgi:uncharacterized Zn-binding protein involved in type VI secretion